MSPGALPFTSFSRLAAVALCMLPLAGCVTTYVLLRNNSKEQTGYLDFHQEQTHKLVALRECPTAVTYYIGRFDSNVIEPIKARRELTDEQRKVLREQRVEGARELSKACLDDVAPSLLADHRYDDLKSLYRAVIDLDPGDAARRDKLTALARKADGLKAAYLKEQAVERWANDDAEGALNALASAISAAKLAADAPLEQAAAALREEYTRAWASKLVAIADAHRKEPTTQHLAMLEYGRSFQLVPAASTKARFESLRGEIFRSNDLIYEVRVRLDAPSDARNQAVVAKLKAFVGGLSYATSGAATKGGVTLRIDVGQLQYSESMRKVSLEHAYVDGTKPAPNPRYSEAQRRVEDARRDVESQRRSLASAMNTQVYVEERLLERKIQKLEELQLELAKTPQTIQVPNERTHTYSAQRTSYQASAPVELVCTAEPFDERVSRSFTQTMSRDRHPGNASVKLAPANPGAPSRRARESALLDKVTAAGRALLEQAIQVRLNQQVDAQKSRALSSSAGPARDGQLFRWLLFMPNEAARTHGIDSLPPAERDRANELRALAGSMEGDRLLQPSSKVWKDWVDDGFGRP